MPRRRNFKNELDRRRSKKAKPTTRTHPGFDINDDESNEEEAFTSEPTLHENSNNEGSIASPITGKSRRRKQSIRASVESDSSFSDSKEASNDKEMATVSRQKKKKKQKTSVRSSPRNRNKIKQRTPLALPSSSEDGNSASEDDFEEKDHSSDEDFEVVESDDADEDLDELGIEEDNGRSTRRQKTKTQKSQATARSKRTQRRSSSLDGDNFIVDDDKEEKEKSEKRPRRTIKSWIPVREKKRPLTKRKIKSAALNDSSDEEEFLADSATENSDEKEVFYTDSDDEDQESISLRNRATNIDNDDIGSADASSDDEFLGNKRPISTSSSHNSNSQLDEIQTSPAKKKGNDDNSSEGEDSDYSKSHFSQRIVCTSTTDAITLERLPKVHVCFLYNNGNSRQCFSIETLRQIALKSGKEAFRVDIDGTEKSTFLQPPHFRATMSDNLLDQIASRFGRQALDLNGDFYNRKKDLPPINDTTTGTILDFFGNADPNHDFGEEFDERVNTYINSHMGSRDVYCCCLCYSEMHRRIIRGTTKANGDELDVDNEKFLRLAADSEYDPMTVLGWLDNDKFEAASCFCFGKAANLKKHLREAHLVQTKEIQGNDLYERYKIRGQDGLLQRFLHNSWKKSRHSTFQGSMQRYWFDGANQSFIYLVEMIAKAENQRRNLVSEDDDLRDEAQTYFNVAMDFFESFQSRAQMEWEDISSPFKKNAQNDDLRDFLADEEDEEEGQMPYNFLAHREGQIGEDDNSDPNDFVSKIQRKYAENDQTAGSDDVAVEDEIVENEELSVSSDLKRSGYYSEVEDEKDEWVTKIQMKRRKSAISPSQNGTPKTTPRGKKLTRKKITTPSTGTTIHEPSTSSTLKRRVIVEDSSSEEDL